MATHSVAASLRSRNISSSSVETQFKDDEKSGTSTSSMSSSLSSSSSISEAEMSRVNKLLANGSNFADGRARQFKKRSRHQTWLQYLADRQIKYSSSLIFTLIALHTVPAMRPYTDKFLYLHHVDEATNTARKGPDDFYFVVFWFFALTLLRALLMEYVLAPLAKLGGISKTKAKTRFAEQGWSVVYYTASFSTAIYLMYQTKNLRYVQDIWSTWPQYKMSINLKKYYLIQLACWWSQVYVLNVEERRKDHYQMFTHHIITIILVTGSYLHHYLYAGFVMLSLMDVGDILLAAAKMLKYLGFQTLCDLMFGAFLLSWLVCRHFLYNYVVYSAMSDAFVLIEDKCYYDTDGSLVICFNPIAHWILVSMLICLQGILFIWLFMILRVVLKILRGGGADDSRSDEDDDNEEEEDFDQEDNKKSEK